MIVTGILTYACPFVLREYRFAHGSQGRHDRLGLLHEARPEGAVLHAFAGAPHVEVDFVVAQLLADPRGVGESFRAVASELAHDGVLDGTVAQQGRVVQDGLLVDHLGVEYGAAREVPEEHAEGLVRDVLCFVICG